MMAEPWKPEPIEVGDPVEVQVAGKGFHVGRVASIENGVYVVTFGRGRRSYRTRAVTYHPTPEQVAQRALAVRGNQRLRTEVTSDFVGFDGPGIKETALVTERKVVA